MGKQHIEVIGPTSFYNRDEYLGRLLTFNEQMESIRIYLKLLNCEDLTEEENRKGPHVVNFTDSYIWYRLDDH